MVQNPDYRTYKKHISAFWISTCKVTFDLPNQAMLRANVIVKSEPESHDQQGIWYIKKINKLK